MRTIETLRAESKDAKRLAKELADAQAQLAEHETAKLSETEKLAAKVTALEKSLAERDAERRTLLVRTEIERQARKLGIVDEDAAYRLLDLDALEYDEGGAPKNVDKLLAKLLEAKPYLKAPTDGRSAVPATPRGTAATAADKVAEKRQILRATGAYTPF